MSEPTEQDRKTALDTWLANDHVEAIAQALADEREKARAPFRRLALDVKDGWHPSADRLADAILTYTGGYDVEAEQ